MLLDHWVDQDQNVIEEVDKTADYRSKQELKMVNEIRLSKLSLEQIQEFKLNHEFLHIAKIQTSATNNSNESIRCRTIDSALHDAIITIISGISLNLASSFIYDLSVWIYDKYKENRIKKPMINGVEIDIENITPEEILSIITKNKDISEGEDGTP